MTAFTLDPEVLEVLRMWSSQRRGSGLVVALLALEAELLEVVGVREDTLLHLTCDEFTRQ
jgi:hypothetical protein